MLARPSAQFDNPTSAALTKSQTKQAVIAVDRIEKLAAELCKQIYSETIEGTTT
jgi:hypothetical protein